MNSNDITPTPPAPKTYIWWLNPAEIVYLLQRIEAKSLALPEYIESELRSMEGCPLRQRLWMHSSVAPYHSLVPWDENHPTCRLLTILECGGLVIHALDLEAVKVKVDAIPSHYSSEKARVGVITTAAFEQIDRVRSSFKDRLSPEVLTNRFR